MEKSNLLTSGEAAKGKKRTADKITPEKLTDDDEFTNMLRDIYESRKKKNEIEGTKPNAVKQEKDNKIVTLKELKITDNVEKVEKVEKIEKPEKITKVEINAPVEETKEPNIAPSDKKWLYLNKLIFYTKEDYRDCMVSFKEMMFEDLCKDPKTSKKTLEAAFMTTYGYKLTLLEPLLKSNVRLILANDLTIGSGLKLIEKEWQGYPNLTLIHPPKVTDSGLHGAFHPKLWLLKFPSTLRVVVSSGNLTPYDWSIWSNCLWFQDFPKKTSQHENRKKTSTNGFDFNKDFKETLEAYVQAIMPTKKIDYKSILKFDLNDYVYENVDVVLIPSLPGRFRDEMMNKYGIGKVKYILEKFPCHNTTKPNRKVINYQATSIGQVTEKYIGEFAASVLPGFKSLNELATEQKHAKKSGKDQKQTSLFPQSKSDSLSAVDRVRLIYPTETYIETCVSGVESGGCLFLKKDFYDSGKLPKKIFHQYEGAAGTVGHLKVFVVTDDDDEINDDTIIYFGSHNFSPAAWGKYEKDFTQISIMNSELGVLIPPMKGSAERKKDLISNLSFKIPPKKYSATDRPYC